MHSLPLSTRVSAMPTRPSSTVIPRQKVMSVSESGPGSGGRRLLREEIGRDAFIDCIHFCLQGVAELMEAASQNRLHAGEIEFAAHHAQTLFAGACEGPDRRPGNGMQAAVGAAHTVTDGSRELSVQKQELHDAIRRNPSMPL